MKHTGKAVEKIIQAPGHFLLSFTQDLTHIDEWLAGRLFIQLKYIFFIIPSLVSFDQAQCSQKIGQFL